MGSMINILRFFFNIANPNFEELSDDQKKSLCFLGSSAVICGPNSCGKTSLCWSFCHSVAAEGERALILCNKKKLEGKGIPQMTDGRNSVLSNAPSVFWKSVDLKYVESAKEVIELLLSIQIVSDYPRVIVLEDILTLTEGSAGSDASLRNLSLLLASISDAQREIQERLKKSNARSSNCVTLITCSTPYDGLYDRLFSRWCNHLVELKKVEGASNLLLYVNGEAKVRYSTKQALTLVETIDEKTAEKREDD